MSHQKTGQTLVVATKRPTLEMVLALASFIAGVLASLTFEQVQTLLKNKNGLLRKKLLHVFDVTLDPLVGVVLEWEKFYLDHFGIMINFSGVKIPAVPSEGSWQLIFVPQGLTLNATIVAMRKSFKVWVYVDDGDLDADIITNTRTSAQSYAVWVRVGAEPDVEYIGKSTRVADMDGKIGTTLLEHLVFYLKYFTETGKHPMLTFCTGSRNTEGRVPCVYWFVSNKEVTVDWCTVDNSSATSGLRQAVS